MQRLIQQNLLRAQQRMKSQADKKRVEQKFSVGDKVYLKLQPYVQTSLGNRSNQKFSYKYFGPYEVLSKVGAVAYKLQLPAGSKIHPVVHVSLLKQALLSNNVAQPDLPSKCSVLEDVSTPLQWSGLSASWTTWENEARLRQEYPNATAWGQAAFQERENATDQPTTKPK
ncbi:uncharacterized protein [Lolium perenne]|uniref:uncharacterized protein n=1 Tax=Lolium perenne TaxID=4522 RepID=UPI003A9A6357